MLGHSVRVYIDVLVRIGFRSLFFRLVRIFTVKFGFAIITRPIKRVTNSLIIGKCPSVIKSKDVFFNWWLNQPQKVFKQCPEIYRELLGNWLTESDVSKLRERATLACSGKIFAFRSWYADYGDPTNWFIDPVSRNTWPSSTHSFKIGHQPKDNNLNDIKYVWEVGRFIHLADVIRYLFFSKDRNIKCKTIHQIKSFEDRNFMYSGIHWISEQEVAIRTLFFTRLLFVLRTLKLLNTDDTLLLMRQIFAGAMFCYKENNYAKHCIGNNHFLAGGIAMYMTAVAFPWHKHAKKWKSKGRDHIIKSLDQWNKDGGYVQPSHNYHRLALNYLLYAKLFSNAENDQNLEQKITKTIKISENFLYEFMELDNGFLPNWGPNDGSQICCWTKCNYDDFRPVIKAAQILVDGASPINSGSHDEYLFWMGNSFDRENKFSPRSQSSVKIFNNTGLLSIRSPHTKLSAFCRLGPIYSRYGQQSDLHHFDLFYNGKNILLDAGSFCYGLPDYHDWFRSSNAHNTASINGHDQFKKFSKFLYVFWPKSTKCIKTPKSKDILFEIEVIHNGFKEISSNITHKRNVRLHREGYFIISDFLDHSRSVVTNCILNWNILKMDHCLNSNSLKLWDDLNFMIKWKCNNDSNHQIFCGSENPIAGWHARRYGEKQESLNLRIESKSKNNCIFNTLLGPIEKIRNVEFDDLKY